MCVSKPHTRPMTNTLRKIHYTDVIMDAIASQITSLTIVYSTFYLGADQRKHQSSASLAFVRGIRRGLVNSPHKWPVTRKMFPFDDVIVCKNIPIRYRVDILACISCYFNCCNLKYNFWFEQSYHLHKKKIKQEYFTTNVKWLHVLIFTYATVKIPSKRVIYLKLRNRADEIFKSVNGFNAWYTSLFYFYPNSMVHLAGRIIPIIR